MKRYNWMILFLAFWLTGCSSDGILQEATVHHSEPALPTLQIEQPTPSAPSDFPETLPPNSEPPVEEILPTMPVEQSVPSSVPAEPEVLPSTEEPLPNEPIPSQSTDESTPDDEDFVCVKTYLPNLVVDLRYSTENNFTNQQIYNFSDAWLRYGTVKKLILVQEELAELGLHLKLWDGFRPISAQFKLWEICPDPTYVANPNNGFSSHSRGNTVDITLVDENGTDLVMPTGFDEFSTLADRDYSDCDAEAAANAMFLEETMKKHGFKPYSGEWWHFSDTQSYPVEQEFEPPK